MTIKVGDLVRWVVDGREGIVMHIAENGIRALVQWGVVTSNWSTIDARTLQTIGPRLWWLHEVDDTSSGAVWTREPDADDIAFVEKESGKKHAVKRFVPFSFHT